MSLLSLPDDTTAPLEFDVIIIGTGPAGLSIATELMDTPLKVALLESGQLTPDAHFAALDEIENIGHTRAPVETVRYRGFGGASTLWTGRCGRLDEIDFAKRPWLAQSGWPIESDTLTSYYQRAGAYLGLSRTLDAQEAQTTLAQPFDKTPWDPQVFAPVAWQFSDGRAANEEAVRQFTAANADGLKDVDVLQHSGATSAVNVGQKLRQRIENSETVSLFVGATVCEILSDAAGATATGVTVRAQDKTEYRFQASRIVVACGGIENARLLLASRSVRPNGLGNDHDQVGRYLTDHTYSILGTMPRRAGTALRRRLGTRWGAGGKASNVHCLGLRLSDSEQRSHELLNAAVHIVEFGERDSPLKALGTGVQQIRKGRILAAVPSLASAFGRPKQLWMGLYDRLVAKRMPLSDADLTMVGCVVEQELDPESRITLSPDKTDWLGQPIAQVDWRLSHREFETAKHVFDAFEAERTRLGLGTMERPGWVDQDFESWRAPLLDLAHPSCATRMSDDPSTGVVDMNCEVFGVKGLYMAGSSVFATPGHMNPTQSLVALSLRLADHIKASHPDMADVPSAPIRVGFIGGGNRIQTIYQPALKALAPDIKVVGALTRSAESASTFEEQTGWAGFHDQSTFLNEARPDLIIAALPTAAIEHEFPNLVDLGIPLLLETPISWSERKGRKLVSKIEASGRMVGVAEQFPYLPHSQLTAQLIAQGAIGQVTAVVNDFAVYDYHGIALLRALGGRHTQPVQVTATAHQVGNEQWSMGKITCADGSLLVHNYSAQRAASPLRPAGQIEVHGTKGTVGQEQIIFAQADQDPITAQFQHERRKGDLKAISVQTPNGPVTWENPFFGHALNEEQIAVAHIVSEMCQAVRNGGPVPYTPAQALEDVELLAATRYSANRGGVAIRMPLSPVKEKIKAKLSQRAMGVITKITKR